MRPILSNEVINPLAVHPLPELRERSARWDSIVLIITFAIFASASAYCSFESTSFIEGDAASHYLISRFAAQSPLNLVSVWGRPLCTLLYLLPAQAGRGLDPPNAHVGMVATGLMSLALALMTAWATYCIAKKQGFRLPALAAIFVVTQPFFFLHSFCEMTELPFAAVLVLAFFAYQSRQWLLMAIIAGWLPLARPEGFGFVLLAAAALAWYGRWWWLPVLGAPFLAWNYAGWALSRALIPGSQGEHWYLWVQKYWPYSAHSVYASGSLESYVIRLPLLVGPVVFPFLILGFIRALKKNMAAAGVPSLDEQATDEPAIAEPSFSATPNRQRPLHVRLWIALIPAAVLVIHSIIYWRGWMGSNGQLRYLVICTPFWALLTADGFEWAWTRLQPRLKLRWPHAVAGAIAVLPCAAMFQQRFVPLQERANDLNAKEVANWWHSDAKVQRQYPHLVSSLPSLSFYLDVDFSRPEHSAAVGRQGVAHPTPGTLLVWDPDWGPKNADENLCVTEDMIRAGGWVFVKKIAHKKGTDDNWCDLYLSPTDKDGKSTQEFLGKDSGPATEPVIDQVAGPVIVH